LLITLNTNKKFIEELDHLLKEELNIASKKWGVSLSDENKSAVTHRSFEQLVNKVQFISGNPWQLGKAIRFSIGDDDSQYTLPTRNLPKIYFNRTIDKWVVAQDVNEESVIISDFYNIVIDEIKDWAKTAMFYGVGSFRD
jgi:hypothetical protein